MIQLRLALVVILTIACLAPAIAQDAEPGADFTGFEAKATDAEALLEDPDATNVDLEAMRTDLADWRTTMRDAQSVNAEQIETVNQQIAALGPAPAEGDPPEAPDIAERRETLTEQLVTLRAPQLAAEEAFTRASGLIRQIDNRIRSRQAETFFSVGPAPINPRYWDDAARDYARVWVFVREEFASSVNNPDIRAQFWRNLPAIVLQGLLAALFILRGRALSLRLEHAVRQWLPDRAARVLSPLLSLFSIAVPLAGVALAINALSLSGLLGFHTQPVADALFSFAAAILVAAWLARRVFPKEMDREDILLLDEARRREGRIATLSAAVLIGLTFLIRAVNSVEGFSFETLTVTAFPIVILLSFFLFRLGRLLGLHVAAVEAASDDPLTIGSRVIRFLSFAARIIGIAAPVAAAVGYLYAALQIVVPALNTLALFAFLRLLQRFIGDLFAWATRSEEAREGLLPAIIGLLLVIAALPALALIWGARVADLTELWDTMSNGIPIGDSRISPTDLLTLLIVFLIGYGATRILQSTLRGTVLPKTRMDIGARNALVSGVGYVGIFLAALAAISATSLDLSSLAIVAGALSVGIGFGLQTIVSNFVSGIILLIERPISEGDWIEVGTNMGYVRKISVRSTRIETFDRTDVIVPNADLVSGTVTNWTRFNTMGRVIVPVGVAYGTDTRRVEGILKEIAEANPMVQKQPPPAVIFQGFGADSLDFEIRAILRDVNYMLTVKSEINHAIAARFAEEGIEIPFAQRDVWLRNPEALRGPADPAEGDPA
ncbi:MAG: DUF3772 domain-containing protein [Pseudomonadota bacterium]